MITHKRGPMVGLCALLTLLATGMSSHPRSPLSQNGVPMLAQAQRDTARKHLFVVRFYYETGTSDEVKHGAGTDEVEDDIVHEEWRSLPKDSMELATIRDLLERSVPPDTANPCNGLSLCDVLEVREGPGIGENGKPNITLSLRIGPPRRKAIPKHPEHAPAPQEGRDSYPCPYTPRKSNDFKECRKLKAGILIHVIERHFADHRAHP